MTESVLSARDGAVLTLTINRPEALNALNPPMMRALRTNIDAAGRDAGIGAIVLTGAGRAFCAGADLKDVSARLAAGETDVGNDLRENYVPLTRAIRSCPRPVIAALNGTAAGAGLSLALACDLRIAVAGAELIVAFVRAEAAQQLGLIAAVVPPDQLMTVALERARRLAEGPRQTHALIKRGMERALDLDLEQVMELESHLQTLAARTADAQEAIRAFVEKRKPVFRA